MLLRVDSTRFANTSQLIFVERMVPTEKRPGIMRYRIPSDRNIIILDCVFFQLEPTFMARHDRWHSSELSYVLVQYTPIKIRLIAVMTARGAIG